MARVIISLIICLVGAIDILFAISDFRKKEYFMFGLWAMSFCYKLVILVRVNLVGC